MIRKSERRYQNDIRNIWTFLGLAVVLGIAISLISRQSKERYEIVDLIKSPKPGDVYEYQTAQGNYSTMRIVNVTADSIFFIENQFETATILAVAELDKPENYFPTVLGRDRSMIDSMYEFGVIVFVDRSE